MKSGFNDGIFKLSRIEVFFFLVIFFVFPVVTDFEFNFYERGGSTPLLELLTERLVYGIIGAIPYLVYYKAVIPYLFAKRYLLFVLLVLLFLAALTVYTKYGHWLVSRMTFLPGAIVESAGKWYTYEPQLFRFSVIFVFRELLMLSALAYFIRSSTQEKQMQVMRRQQLETELEYLKIQLQPHFFFNTLNNIYALALQRSEQTAPLVAKHAEMMRYVLYYSKNQFVKLNQEVDFLKNYTEVERLRYPETTDIRFDEQGIGDIACIEPFLLLPFIENAFKHGIREETGAGFVYIIICFTLNELTMEVRNSKSAIPPDEKQAGGIGLENARSRLSLLYPDHQLIVNESAEAYEVSLNLILSSNG
jgi:sensor histidine kinase YesM